MERKFMGVDYHKRCSHVTVLDEGGRVLRQGKIPNTEEAVAEVVESQEGVRAVLEAGRNRMVRHDWVEEYCEEVKLAHPQGVKAIASAKIKTDEIDSRVLADLLRADLIPEAHVPRGEVRVARYGMIWLRELDLCREERRLLDGALHLLAVLKEAGGRGFES